MDTNGDFLDGLGLLALGSRLKRLSDAIVADGARIYDDLAIDFAPRWFPLLRLLADRAPIGISDAADALRITQPAVSQFAREMSAAGLIQIENDPGDERRRLLSLSPKGAETVANAQPAWRWIEAAVTDIIYEAEADMLTILRRIEQALQRLSLHERTMRLARAAQHDPVDLIDFTPEFRDHWYRLGAEWIAREYVLEPADISMLENPEREVIEPGGAIAFARLGAEIVGAVGLLKMEENVYELIKMGVTPAARGLGVGRKLAERMIQIARERGAKRIVLETNRRARAAIQLYRSLGFVHVPPFSTSFSRADTFMAMDLTPEASTKVAARRDASTPRL